MYEKYRKRIRKRSKTRFLIGLWPRFINYMKFAFNRKVARLRGAKIGKGSVIPFSLAKKANKNLIIGNHCIINTDTIDLRCPVTIGDYVIITGNVSIITVSHYIDTPEWEHKYYGLTIEDYVWIPVNVMILPSCRRIGYGAVVGSGSVVVKNVNEMSVVSGNPAKEIRKRKCVHSELLIEENLSADLPMYLNAYLK